MQSAREERVAEIARLWIANAYLAQGRHDHAYLELSRLRSGGLSGSRKADVETKMRVCEKHLSAEALSTLRSLLAPSGGDLP